MINKLNSTVFCSAIFVIVLHTCNCEPLAVTLYYETLCPYSRDFFVNQLQPIYEKFNNSVTWILIPYGNAKTERDQNGKAVGIMCQHKANECLGNAIQACALRKLSDAATQLRFCVCFMVNKGDCAAFQKCALSYGIDYIMINACASSGEGLEYLAEYGDVQNQLQPKLSGVPTLAMHGKELTPDENTAFYENSCTFLCDRMTLSKPDVCNSCPAPAPSSSPSPSPSPPPSTKAT